MLNGASQDHLGTAGWRSETSKSCWTRLRSASDALFRTPEPPRRRRGATHKLSRSMREKNPQTHEEKLAYLRELREQAINSASEEAVEKQHARGKLTARERIEKLLDPGSFEELDVF